MILDARVLAANVNLLILIERKMLSREEIVEAVETVLDSKRNLVEAGEHPEISRVAMGVLALLGNSVAASRIRSERK